MAMQSVRSFVFGVVGGSGGVLLTRYLYPEPPVSVPIVEQKEAEEVVKSPSLGRILKYGVPGPGMRTLLEYENHVLEYDPVRRVPKWVAEHVSKDKAFGESANRKLAKFDRDPLIPTQFASENTDFWGSGWSRGHMAPAGNNKHSQSAMNQTFFLTNIVPQDLENNGNYWNRLEMYCRELTKIYSDVYIISGPLWLPENSPSDYDSPSISKDSATNTVVPQGTIEQSGDKGNSRIEVIKESIQKDNIAVVNVQNITEKQQTAEQQPVESKVEKKPRKVRPPRPPKKFVKYEVIGNNNVAVPTHLFKIILVEDAGIERPMMSSFIIPNKPVQDVKLEDFESDLFEIERHVGVKFHQDLDPANVDKLCLKTGCRLNNYKEFQEFFWVRKLSSPWNLFNLEKDWKELNKKGLKNKKLEDLYLSKKNEFLEKERAKAETKSHNESSAQSDSQSGTKAVKLDDSKAETKSNDSLAVGDKPVLLDASQNQETLSQPRVVTAAAGG